MLNLICKGTNMVKIIIFFLKKHLFLLFCFVYALVTKQTGGFVLFVKLK